MRDAVLATIARYDLLPPGTRVIAAVSGGPDSVCLVRVLRELEMELGVALVGVGHVNHQLRGAESDEDQRFVEGLARSLDLPFFCASGAVGEGNVEQNARRARRRFFRQLIDEGKADRVALGHTRDDQAETVLFRILRGAGPSGLAGVLPITAEGLIRPMLGASREQVLAYLGERGIAWREDSSNRSLQFTRNRLRHELLPHLTEAYNPRVKEALANLADVSFEEETWWAGEMARAAPAVLKESAAGLELATEPLRSFPRALQRRLVREAMRQVKGDLRGMDHRHVEAIRELAVGRETSGRVTVPGLMAIRSFDRLLLGGPGAAAVDVGISIPGPGRYPWPASKALISIELSSSLPSGERCDTLGVSRLQVPLDLELRAWRPGDRYQPEGHAHPIRVKELFQKARIPSWERASWPILTSKGKILWVKKFGPAAGLEGAAAAMVIREIPYDIVSG